jgi:hypothetical protein
MTDSIQSPKPVPSTYSGEALGEAEGSKTKMVERDLSVRGLQRSVGWGRLGTLNIEP